MLACLVSIKMQFQASVPQSSIIRWCIGLLLAMAALTAQATTVLVLSSRPGGAYDEVIDSIRTEVTRSTDLRVQYLSGPWKPADSVSLIVAVGVDAASSALQTADAGIPILCVLIPRIAYDALTANRKDNRKISALYLDTPVHRQLELIRLLLPQARNVGAVIGTVSQKDKEILKAGARERGLNLVVEQANRDSELYSALKTVLAETEAFLAVPDPVVMNASTAQNVLITAFRSQVPVIGYTSSYVRAGALAAVFSTPQQIGQEAGQIIKAYQRTSSLPPSKYPRYFSVGLNVSVMRTMGLSTTDEHTLTQRLLKAE